MKRLTLVHIGSAAFSRCCKMISLISLAVVMFGAANAATVTVTNAAGTGPGSLTDVINALHDGDTIAFNIPGAGVHYINTPFDGYPLITNNDITIDGYTQPGAVANTNSLHESNTAQLNICLTSTNGNALSMLTACEDAAGITYSNFGFGDTETAMLGFFRASNAWVRGVAFLASPWTATTEAPPDPTFNNAAVSKAICFAMDAPDISSQGCQGFHVSGCWFGVDPTSHSVAYCNDPLGYGLGLEVATPAICIATYGSGANVGSSNLWPGPGTVGVASNSANPRAEFNVFVTGYGFDCQGGPLRVSGNFWGVLPDGVTLADMTDLNGGQQQSDAFAEFGSSHDILIGTDGNGVNDADEGNIFGPYANDGSNADGMGEVGLTANSTLYFYSSPETNIVIAGNTFGLDIHGNTFGIIYNYRLVHSFDNVAEVRFGSDFNGVSDALEANTVVNVSDGTNLLFDYSADSSTNSTWLSMRGNSLVNTMSISGTTPPLGNGSDPADGQYWYDNFMSATNIIPVIDTNSTATTLMGTCGTAVGAPFTNLIVDLYVSDPLGDAAGIPQGKTWLAAFVVSPAAAAAGTFAFDITSMGLSGKSVTLTVTYTSDTPPTLGPIQRAGNQTTLTVTGGTGPIYGIKQSSVVTGPYTYIAAQTGASTTFTDNATPTSFYVAQGASATGQTSPFATSFRIP
jgi:hypothetical protein